MKGVALYTSLGLGAVAAAASLNLMERVFSNPVILDLVRPDAPIENKAMAVAGAISGVSLAAVCNYLFFHTVAYGEPPVIYKSGIKSQI